MLDPQEIVRCLGASLDANPDTRKASERKLAEYGEQSGYGAILAQVATSAQIPADIRQLAAVVLRQHIKRSWNDGSRISAEERQSLKETLPLGLSDPDSKVRTAIGMSIAGIAKWDFPHQWPGLLESLLGNIKHRTEPNQGDCARHVTAWTAAAERCLCFRGAAADGVTGMLVAVVAVTSRSLSCKCFRNLQYYK